MKKILIFSLALASMFSSCKKTETEYVDVLITDKVDEKVEIYLKRPEVPEYVTSENDLAKKQVAPAVYDKNTNTAKVVYENGMVADFANIDFDKNTAVLVKLQFEEKTLSKEAVQYEDIELMSAFYVVNDDITLWIKVTELGNGKDVVVQLNPLDIISFKLTIPATIAKLAINSLSNVLVVCPTTNQLTINPDALGENPIIEIPFYMMDDYNAAYDNLGFLADLFHALQTNCAEKDEDFEFSNFVRFRSDAAVMLSEDVAQGQWTSKEIYTSYQSTMVLGQASFMQRVICAEGSFDWYDRENHPEIVSIESSNPEVVKLEQRDDRMQQANYYGSTIAWYAIAKKAGHATITATFYYKGLKYVASRNIEVKKVNQEDLFFNFIKYQPSGSYLGKAYYTDNSGKIIHSTTISYEDEYNFGLAEGEYYNNIFREISNLELTYDSKYFDKFELVEGESMFSVKAKRIEGTTNVIVKFNYCGLPVELNQEIEVKQRY